MMATQEETKTYQFAACYAMSLDEAGLRDEPVPLTERECQLLISDLKHLGFRQISARIDHRTRIFGHPIEVLA